MTRQARVLSVLIASPMDVAGHRDALERGVQLWNRGPLSKHLGVVLEVLRWEHDAVPMLGEGDAQQVINAQLAAEADIVVAVFHSRLGSPTERHPSGTAEEIDVGLTRRAPVHVYVDKSPLPDDHQPEQYERLNEYLKELAAQGLLAEFQGQDQLLQQVRHALEHDITQLLEQTTVEASANSGSLRERLNAAADLVQSAEVYQTGVSFNAHGQEADAIYARRRGQLFELAGPLFNAVIEVARGDDDSANELLIELLDVLARNPYAGGLVVLVEQTRYVSALAFHIAGVVACSTGNDTLVGMLLGAEPTMTDPTRGQVPMSACFPPEIAASRGRRGTKELHDELAELLAPDMSPGTFNRAWETWNYLYAVANTYFLAAKIPAARSWPYLLVKDMHTGNGLSVDVAARVRAKLDKAGDSHPALVAGLCGGSHDLFNQAAETFESNYGQQAEQADWQALPGGSGWLPSAPHYPGER